MVLLRKTGLKSWELHVVLDDLAWGTEIWYALRRSTASRCALQALLADLPAQPLRRRCFSHSNQSCTSPSLGIAPSMMGTCCMRPTTRSDPPGRTQRPEPRKPEGQAGQEKSATGLLIRHPAHSLSAISLWGAARRGSAGGRLSLHSSPHVKRVRILGDFQGAWFSKSAPQGAHEVPELQPAS